MARQGIVTGAYRDGPCVRHTVLLLLLLALVVGLCAVPSAALPPCTKVDDCSCKTPDGKAINIRSLGNKDGKTPRWVCLLGCCCFVVVEVFVYCLFVVLFVRGLGCLFVCL